MMGKKRARQRRPMQLRRQLPGTTSSVVVLTPPNIPTAAGGSTNQNRAAACVVGYQDAGNGTPYHALRWTSRTGRMTSARSTPPTTPAVYPMPWRRATTAE
jgi:hypothetical protein